MPINVLCSQCEVRLNLNEDLLGKQMRCPICHEIFTVEIAPAANAAGIPEAAEPAVSSDKPTVIRADPPTPKYRSGSITDFLQVLTSEAAHPSSPTVPTAHSIIPADASLVDIDEVFSDFEVVEDEPKLTSPRLIEEDPLVLDAVVEGKPKPSSLQRLEQEPLVLEAVAPGPKEFVWSNELALPPSSNYVEREPLGEPEIADVSPADESDEDEHSDSDWTSENDIVRPRRRRKKSRLALMLFLLLFIVGGLGFGGFYLKKYLDEAPERLYAQAKKEYEAGNYEPARKLFDEFVKEQPKDPRNPEAKFFVELSSLRAAVLSVANRANPAPAQEHLQRFLKLVEAPAMKDFVAQGRFNADVSETALKLTEDIYGKAREGFKRDDPEPADVWLRQAIALGPVVDRFRSKGLDRESIFGEIQKLGDEIEAARARLQFLAQIRARLSDPDDDIIVGVRRTAEERGYGQDGEFLRLIADAEQKIADRVVYRRIEPPIAPVRDRGAGGTGLLFVPRLDLPTSPPEVSAGPPMVFFAIARGVLYALDEYGGHVLWATRIGIDSDRLPLPIPASDLHPELALVVSNDGVHSSLTARLARSGEAIWHQPLPSTCMGPPILVGQRVYVPLRDKPSADGAKQKPIEIGVVLEIEIGTGSVIGRIALGRPIGAKGLRRPGTGQIYFPAEAKGVYVFDVERRGPDGTRLDPAKIGMLPIGHEAGTLRGEPIITSGEADSTSYLILGFADGLESMKLRAYPLTPADKPLGFAGEIPAPIPLSGWTWFAPYCDSEKLAVVTDRGEFGLFGIKQAGNLDVPIFALPPDPFTLPDVRVPARGQIVHADEESFWFLARGAVRHVRIGFFEDKGLKLISTGQPLSLGEPLQAAQVNARGDTALLVTQASASGSIKATALDLRTGGIRWQRQIGLVAQGDPVRIGDAIVLMDQDGGLYRFDAKPLATAANAEWLIDERWLVAAPFPHAAAPANFLRSADGQSVYAIAQVRGPEGPRIAVRQFQPGQPVKEQTAELPAPLAGSPIVLGKMVILPLANGLLHRFNLDSDKLIEPGPTWRGERVSPQAVCHLAAVSDAEFLASDGSRAISRWRWPVDQDEFILGGKLELPEKIAAPPIAWAGKNGRRTIVADAKNNVTMWDLDKFGIETRALRIWRSSEKGPIPVGPITSGPFLESDAKGNPRICYAIDGVNIVWLDPDADKPVWVSIRPIRVAGDGIVGRPRLLRDRLYVSDRIGRFLALDVATGAVVRELARLKGSAAPTSSAIPIEETALLAPLSDGTLLLQPLGEKKPLKLPVFFFALPPFGIPVPVPFAVE